MRVVKPGWGKVGETMRDPWDEFGARAPGVGWFSHSWLMSDILGGSTRVKGGPNPSGEAAHHPWETKHP